MAFGTLAFDTLQTSDSKNTGTNKTLDTSFIYNGSAKSWVKFDGSVTTPVALDSFSSSSITDSATGNYINNLTNAMENVNYCMSTAGEHDAGSFASFGEYKHDSPNTTTESKVDYHATDGGARDVGNAGQVVHGELA